MFSHNEKFYGKIQDLNNHYRYQAKQEINSGRFKLQSLKTNSGISNIKRKTLIIGSPDKNRSNLNSSNQSRGNSTPIGVSPLHRKVTVRINTTKSVPRKAETMNKRHSFFGSIKNSPLIKSPYDDYEDRKVIEDSMEDNTTVKESIKVQKAVKPEVTISEFDITKKWYDYEKKIGSDLKLPTSLGKKGNVNNKIPQFSPMTICEDISIQGNLKVQRKLTSNLNPLVNKSNIRKSAITPNANDYDDQKISNPKRVSTKMLSITSFGNNNNLNPELKCCDCHPRDIECSKIQLEIELSKSREAEHILKQEISQLRELNRQLIDKLHNYEEHEATVLDKHLEYDRIQEGFDKICQNFSDANDPSLGNLSVRGATKKMLLNLQQFAYEQIAGLKISYTFKLENLKEDYAEELESVYEALSTSALAANQLKAQEMTCDNTKENVVDNSEKIIEELTQNLQAETDRANLVTTNLDKCNLDLTDMKSKFEDLSNKFEKLKEKCDREIDIKMDYKERLEEIENKYQNISISSLHSRISSLKSQLDLQKLEDAKKIYDTNLQNKKLKKAIEALKSFKDTRAKKGNKDGEGDDEEEEADIEESLSPDKIDGNIAEIPPKLAEESEDEDPEEIERKIKKMLQEEEERKKEVEERAKEVPVTDMDDDAYKVDRQNFEKAILNNPHLDGMY